ncbi:MAG: 3-dehydroquinate synthase [Treponema sp.]|nr:3-dehydroquinate synthase [Treponema sp.]
MKGEYSFTFGNAVSRVHIREEVPPLDTILQDMAVPGAGTTGVVLVCDTHTEYLARICMGERALPLCTLAPGETEKSWASVERVLTAAKGGGLGRDGLFVGIGGGVISDLSAFAASVYMRGARLCLISTTLLGMVDAAVGGKTGFDLLGMKNLVGTFYPAAHIYMPLGSLKTLPEYEWKSGMAELIKTAVLDTGEILGLLESMAGDHRREALFDLVCRSVSVKGRIVEADPRETGTERALLNLGHTFAHALESSAGLGRLSHGEAVAWGMVRSCELGLALGITPPARARKIIALIHAYGYETLAPHPLMKDSLAFMQALGGDKKKRAGKLMFVVPAAEGAALVSGDRIPPRLLENIITGEKKL